MASHRGPIGQWPRGRRGVFANRRPRSWRCSVRRFSRERRLSMSPSPFDEETDPTERPEFCVIHQGVGTDIRVEGHQNQTRRPSRYQTARSCTPPQPQLVVSWAAHRSDMTAGVAFSAVEQIFPTDAHCKSQNAGRHQCFSVAVTGTLQSGQWSTSCCTNVTAPHQEVRIVTRLGGL